MRPSDLAQSSAKTDQRKRKQKKRIGNEEISRGEKERKERERSDLVRSLSFLSLRTWKQKNCFLASSLLPFFLAPVALRAGRKSDPNFFQRRKTGIFFPFSCVSRRCRCCLCCCCCLFDVQHLTQAQKSYYAYASSKMYVTTNVFLPFCEG